MKGLNYTLIDFAMIASVGLLCGCAVTKPLKGGKATTMSKPAHGIEQTMVQSDNPAQTSRQDQETVKTRSYTVPTGSRLEESRVTAITVGGLLLTVLPTLIVGNELLILGGVLVAVGGWFLAHRHGRLQEFVDANKNGVDDRIEAALARLNDEKNPNKS